MRWEEGLSPQLEVGAEISILPSLSPSQLHSATHKNSAPCPRDECWEEEGMQFAQLCL